jgi:hypothetical protein
MSTGKTVVVGRKSFDAMADELSRHHVTNYAAELVPPGWFTVKQYARAAGLSRDAAKALLMRGVHAGRFDQQQFRTATSHGRVIPIMHFRIVKKSTARRR